MDKLVDEQTAAKIRDYEKKQNPDEFIVLPENWETIQFFLRINNLWQSAPMGGISSLDWAAINGKIQIIETRSEERIPLEVIEGIELMERAAVSEMREK